MTIIYERGKKFWIEYHQVSVTLEDPAGSEDSAVIPVDRPGVHLGNSVTLRDSGNGDAVRSIGSYGIIGFLGVGTILNNFTIRVQKQISTEGSIASTWHVLLFMRGIGRR